MSNYPPGTSAGDPRAPWNDKDRSHEHEWCEPDGPIFEDGAALFHSGCNYAEGQYGEGWTCDEARWWRCGVDRVIKIRDGEPNIAYLASEEDRLIEEVFMDALITVENMPLEDIQVEACDPPIGSGDGFVRVCVGDFEILYIE